MSIESESFSESHVDPEYPRIMAHLAGFSIMKYEKEGEAG
jgi:hypothetical protein